MSANALPRLTPQQYLEIERNAETRSEYYDGQMYAMSGGTIVHSHIVGNLTRELSQALKKSPCLICPNDLRVQVAENGLYTYPDIVVVCEEPRLADNYKDTLLNPSVIVEVLSKSTEAHDRGFKFAQYRRLDSLREYLLVSQTEPRVEKFARKEKGEWVLTEYVGQGAVCEIESLGCRIPLLEVYEKVAFE